MLEDTLSPPSVMLQIGVPSALYAEAPTAYHSSALSMEQLRLRLLA